MIADASCRSLRELLKVTSPFTIEDRRRSWAAVLSTLALTVAAFALAAAPIALPLRLAASALAALLSVRMFVLYHDFEHGAILRRSRPARWILSAFGLFILSPPAIWNRLHNYHHSHNCQFTGSGIGSFPVLTVHDYARASRVDRFRYRAVRSPWAILCAYAGVFLGGFCLKPVHDEPGRHRDSMAAIALHLVLVALYLRAGWVTLLLGLVGPLAAAHAVGTYLFYAQHNFPGVQLRRREDWDYVHAALHSSSFLELGPVMRWFTANIGYHHVHHLNARIPFYRLPEAMAAVPELQHAGRTTLAWRDVRACLALKLWDPDRGCMVPFP
jgi:omega-6 fatty acid desaturase (delta-12 desaturase)